MENRKKLKGENEQKKEKKKGQSKTSRFIENIIQTLLNLFS